ncbi:unnamed protein product [Calypogeia fissa]
MDTSVVWTVVAMMGVLVLVAVRNFNSWYYEPKLGPGRPPLPPGDMGWPIFGCMFDFLRAFNSPDPNSFTNHYICKYGRLGLYKTHLLGQPTILATTAETVRAVLLGDQQTIVSSWPTSMKVIMGDRSFACVEGEEHRTLRKLTGTSVNGTPTLISYMPLIESIAVDEFENWAECGDINLLTNCKKFALHAIAGVMMSYQEGPETEDFANEFLGICGGIRSIAINLPGTSYHNSLKCRKKLVMRLLDVIEERRRTEKKEHDVLQVLMDAKDEETGSTLTDMECIDTILVYMIAGHESTAYTMLWYMILLHENAHVLKKVREELQAIQAGKQPDEPLSFSDYRKMMYLGHVIDEILRLMNLFPVVCRKANADCVINGFTIPKGWSVESWLRTVHLDPKVYPDPLSFNPDRWNGLKVKPGTFMPFGGGYRLCPGKDFAKMEVSIILYHITLNYDWEPLNPKYKMKYLPHPCPTDGYPVRITRRARVE